MVLKSGSSTLHASAWEFNRNDAFDARNFFNPAPQTVAETAAQCVRLQRRRTGHPREALQSGTQATFFFYNMEWRRLIQGAINERSARARSRHLRRQLRRETINVPSGSAGVGVRAGEELPRRRSAGRHRSGAPFPGQHDSDLHDRPNATAC